MPVKRFLFLYHFAQLSRMILAFCKTDVATLKVNPTYMPFLAELLHHHTPLTQDELSAIMASDKGTTARALACLEKDGFVSRNVNPDNRRQNLVQVTTKARNIEEDIHSVLQKTGHAVMRSLSTEEIEQLHMLLERIIDDLKKQMK